MANEEQVKILRSGVDAWNKWRVENDGRAIDFRSADLSELQLRWADLRNVDLSDANLQRATLNPVDLENANLARARLARTDLTDAHLTGADLSDANLVAADLSEAVLVGCNLTRANLTRANLSGAFLGSAKINGAILSRTVFGRTYLGSIEGLDECLHKGPSIVDHHTLALSAKLPVEFLRGCGLPDFIIDNVAVLRGDPLQFYSCFISHSSKDKTFAERLYNDLQGKGVRCWYAPEDLKIADRFRDRINQAIRVHDKLLLILSEHSVASHWVETEVEKALAEEQRRGRATEDSKIRPTTLFPVRLDDAVVDTEMAWAEQIRSTRHIGDFTEWKNQEAYKKAFDRLLRDLKASTESTGPVKQPHRSKSD